MSGKSGTSMGTSPMSALSASLQREGGQSRSHSQPLAETSIDVFPDGPDFRLPPLPSRVTPRSMDVGSPSSRNDDLGFGTSPMIGSPWPFLVRQQQKPKQEDMSSVAGSPREYNRPARVSWDYRPNTDATHRPSVSSETPRVNESEEPLLPDDPEEVDDPPKEPRRRLLPWNDVLFGIINAIVGIPTMISFCAIVFQDDLYAPFLGRLSKLAFLASAIHQVVFTMISTLPFAVGQVQDVGLIFLSAMATAIAEEGIAKGMPEAEIMGTTLLTIAVATFIVGLLIILVGYFKLATLVQYVPLPVVAGYLAYVGYFCLAAGLSLACNVEINTFPSWLQLFHKEQLIRFAPAAASTLAIWLVLHFSRSPLALPSVLISIPLIFHAVLFATETNLAQAADAGWVMRAEKGKQFWELYEMFNIRDWQLSTIYKWGLIKQAPKVLALFFVVAFGSSLDVAAIQAGSPNPLDYNHELKTVGLSNMVCGALGAGFTGSYIFSQTIFSMRAQVTSRWHGFIIAGSEFALFAIPVSVVQYMPNFFFGSLLMIFGVEIIADWLLFSYRKVTRVEYILLWGTYISIMLTDLEAGIGIGIILSALYFTFSYAKVHVSAFTVVPSRSGVVRSLSERAVLEVFMSRMAAVSLSGFIFFGSSVSISEQVTAVAKALVEHDEEVRSWHNDVSTGAKEANDDSLHPLWADKSRTRTSRAFAAAPHFILLDFRYVHGLDATAAQTFGNLWNQLQRNGVELVLTHLKRRSMKRLLEAHGIVVDAQLSKGAAPTHAARLFDTLEMGVQHCEDRFLEVALQYGLCKQAETVMSLEDTLSSHSIVPSIILGKQLDLKQTADSLASFMEEVRFEAGEEIFRVNEEAAQMFIIEEGGVSMMTSFISLSQDEQEVNFPKDLLAAQPERRFDFGPGAIIGSTDFFLNRPRSFRAFATKRSRMLAISHSAFDRMSKQTPEALIVLLTILVRTSIMDATHVWETLERLNASK